jgi:hypothetical protein
MSRYKFNVGDIVYGGNNRRYSVFGINRSARTIDVVTTGEIIDGGGIHYPNIRQYFLSTQAEHDAIVEHRFEVEEERRRTRSAI